MIKYPVFLLILFPLLCCGQSYLIYHGDTVNRINAHGLKHGRQLYFDNDNRIRSEGVDKIVFNKNIDWTAEKDKIFNTNNHQAVQDRNGNRVLFSAKFNDSLSVPDGYWLFYEFNWFNPLIVCYYTNGIEKIAKSVSGNKIESETITKEKGNEIIGYEYFDGDTSVSKIRYWSGKNRDKIDCFPNRNLIINTCEPGLYALYGKTSIDTILVSAKVNNVTTIKEVTCLHPAIKITNTKGEKISNLLLAKDRMDTVLVYYSPTPGMGKVGKFNNYTSFTIVTPGYSYVLNTHLYGNHIDLSNWKTKEFKIKKNNYGPTILEVELQDFRYFLLPATADPAKLNEYLKDKDNKKVLSVNYWQTPDVNLSDLPPGNYYLVIRDDNDDHKIVNTIKLLLSD